MLVMVSTSMSSTRLPVLLLKFLITVLPFFPSFLLLACSDCFKKVHGSHDFPEVAVPNLMSQEIATMCRSNAYLKQFIQANLSAPIALNACAFVCLLLTRIFLFRYLPPVL